MYLDTKYSISKIHVVFITSGHIDTMQSFPRAFSGNPVDAR